MDDILEVGSKELLQCPVPFAGFLTADSTKSGAPLITVDEQVLGEDGQAGGRVAVRWWMSSGVLSLSGRNFDHMTEPAF